MLLNASANHNLHSPTYLLTLYRNTSSPMSLFPYSCISISVFPIVLHLFQRAHPLSSLSLPFSFIHVILHLLQHCCHSPESLLHYLSHLTLSLHEFHCRCIYAPLSCLHYRRLFNFFISTTAVLIETAISSSVVISPHISTAVCFPYIYCPVNFTATASHYLLFLYHAYSADVSIITYLHHPPSFISTTALYFTLYLTHQNCNCSATLYIV